MIYYFSGRLYETIFHIVMVKQTKKMGDDLTVTKGILTSSKQMFDEQFDCDDMILRKAEIFIDKFCATLKYNNVTLSKEDKEMAQMLMGMFERRYSLACATDIIIEFENTVPESKNFKKIFTKTKKK